MIQHLNSAMAIGDVGEQADDHWILHAQRQFTRKGEPKPEISTDAIPVAGEAPKDKRVFIEGYLSVYPTENGLRTYLTPSAVSKAKKGDYCNEAELIGDFHQLRKRSDDPSKTPFANQLLKVSDDLTEETYTLRATIFEHANFRQITAWENELRAKDADREGSKIKAVGFLRDNSYVDGEGNMQSMLEVIANTLQVLLPAPNKHKAAQERRMVAAKKTIAAKESEEVGIDFTSRKGKSYSEIPI